MGEKWKKIIIIIISAWEARKTLPSFHNLILRSLRPFKPLKDGFVPEEGGSGVAVVSQNAMVWVTRCQHHILYLSEPTELVEHSRFIYQLQALIDISDSSEHSKLRNQVCLLWAAGFEMKSPVYKASGLRFLALCGLHLYRSSQSLTNGQCFLYKK